MFVIKVIMLFFGLDVCIEKIHVVIRPFSTLLFCWASLEIVISPSFLVLLLMLRSPPVCPLCSFLMWIHVIIASQMNESL